MNRPPSKFAMFALFCWGLFWGIWLTRLAIETGHADHVCKAVIDRKDTP